MAKRKVNDTLYIIIILIFMYFQKKKQVVSANVKAVTPSPQSSITKPPSVTTPTDPPSIISTGATPFNKPQATPTEISGHAGPEKRKKVNEKKGFFSRFKKSLKHQDPTEELVPTALSVTSSGGERKMTTCKSHDICVTYVSMCFIYFQHLRRKQETERDSFKRQGTLKMMSTQNFLVKLVYNYVAIFM